MRCNDGVVLVADTKVLRGSVSFNGDKLVQILPNVIMGGAGTSAILERFSDELTMKVREDEITNDKEFFQYVEDRSLDLHNRYSSRGGAIDVVIGIRAGINAELFNIATQNGIAEPIKTYITLGSGEPYGSFLLRQLWNKDLTMIEGAKIAYATINYVIHFNLDESVGGEPQVWFIPDILEVGKTREESDANYPIREAKTEEMVKIKTYSDNISSRLGLFFEDLKKPISSVSK
ncbi:MAG TPA: hypothetical protein VLE02_06145 [Nitrosarchaeum sp.]|nr:hypothetical protein [Nitrosarchaeum sp.]